jgi:hypothetical protein
MRGRGDQLEAKRGYITRLRTQHGFTIEAIAVRVMCSYTLVQKKLKQWGVAPPIEGAIDEPEPDPMPEPEPEPIIEPEPAPEPETGIQPKTARQLLDERNAAILELVDAGIGDLDIAMRLGLSKAIVLGIRHRNGRVKTADEVAHKNRQNAKRMGTMVSARRAHLKTPIEPPIEPPIAALSELEALVDARPERVVIPFEQVTGCHWPFGDIRDNPPLTYCNAACCSVMVRGGDGKLIRTRYCAEHWNKRRASNHTKIVA